MSRPARRVNGHASPSAQPALVHCAVYCRKSTEEGLDRDINSLTVQRHACEEYVRGRAAEGWRLVAETYDDGGWSGATVNRPAFQHLLADIDAGRVSCVVVHRVDRLSRSLLDFARLMHFFQERGVAFVSVTQNFSTADPVGRLTLNLLATFAEFEREMISARTRDKIAASRARGRWTGGTPILGFDVRDGRLVVNEDEAARVREIFRLYEECRSLIRVVEEVSCRGWTGKGWNKADGSARGGRPFDKSTLRRVLVNPLYAGKIRCNGSLVAGEHGALVDEAIWSRVQTRLRHNGSGGYQGERENSDALLKGLLRCARCGCAMTPTYTVKGNRRFRYYVCQSIAKKGAHACPTGRVAAAEVERQVIDRIRAIGRDPDLVAETVRQVRQQRDQLLARLAAEEKSLRRDLRGRKATARRLVAARVNSREAGQAAVDQLAQGRARGAKVEARLAVIPDEFSSTKRLTLEEADVRGALEAFGPVWDALLSAERARILRLVVEVVQVGPDEELVIRFRHNGFQTLATAHPDSGGEQDASPQPEHSLSVDTPILR